MTLKSRNYKIDKTLAQFKKYIIIGQKDIITTNLHVIATINLIIFKGDLFAKTYYINSTEMQTI